MELRHLKVQPSLNLFSIEQIEYVHKNTLKLLEKTGVRVDSEQARNTFLRAGCKSLGDARVAIPGEIIDAAIETAPASIDIFNRRGEKAFTLGENQPCRFGVGVTNLWWEEPETNAIVPFSRKHVVQACRLAERLTHYDVVSTPGVIQDMPTEVSELYATLEMIANCEKPLVLLVAEADAFRKSLDLAQHLCGDLAESPFIIPYFNPVTPLVLNAETSEKVLLAVERGLPIIYSNYGMAGATTPITAASALVTLNAELLAGLVYTQLLKSGAPVILGSLPAMFDMRNMTSIYTPQTMLLNLACAEMMAYYKIPHAGTSGSGPGWGADLSAAGALWMNHLTSCMGKVGLAPFVGGNFDSLVFSPAKVVYADEIIRQTCLFQQGISLNDETIALEQIEDIGPGGNFLASDLTLRLFHEMNAQNNAIWPGYSLENWQAKDAPKADAVLKQRVLEILANLKTPVDYGVLIGKGYEFFKLLC